MAKRNTRGSDDALPKFNFSKASFQKAARILSYLKPFRWKFALGLFFLLATGLTAIAFPRLMGTLIDAGSISVEKINQVGLYLLLLFAGQAVASYFRVVLFVQVTEGALANLRQATYTHLIQMPMTFFSNRRVGELNSRISSDLSLVQETLTTSIAEFIRQLIIIVGGMVALFFTSTQLALAMLASIPVVAVVAVVFGRYIRKFSRQVQDRLAESNTVVEETLQGIANVKAFANELVEVLRYTKSTNDVRDLAIKGGKLRGAFFSFIIFCLFGAIIFLLWYAVHLELNGILTHGQLITFMMYTVFVGASIGGIAEQYAQIQKALGATERIMDILDMPHEPLDLSPTDVLKPLRSRGEVAFRNVEFAYPSRLETTVLRGLSFTVEAGQTVALVGSSGAGKSTVVSLLLRFYDPISGNICIDGQDLQTMSLTHLRNQMALVPQDVLLFGGSIHENIAYGKPGATRAEVEAAAAKANAHTFISEFPEGYETLVGERGVKLSGGQRQRIAIARAVLKDPVILLLDEATSSLDAESERLVQEALDLLMVNRTTIVIAHRLSTIRKADAILVLDKGKVIEKGTHQELMQIEGGLYRQLSTLQSEPKSSNQEE
jgi:ABC transporter fused permease/ATP-binding protein